MSTYSAAYHDLAPVTGGRLWTGRILSGLAVVFLLFDAGVKFSHIPAVADSFNQLGYPVTLAPVIGTLLFLLVALYIVPRTSILGAILLTGYLGGAVASHVRVGNPLVSHILFPTYIAALLWGGLYLRDRRLRILTPLDAR